MTGSVLSPLARRVVPLLDLTRLDEACTERDVGDLCASARAHGVAAVCVWPRFVARAKEALAGASVKVATVLNFPQGEGRVGQLWDPHADAADEIDAVFPWRAFLEGRENEVREIVADVRKASGPRLLKLILESGAFPSSDSLRAACDLCIDGGADFLKTSTGKHPVGATPEAVRVLAAASRAAGAHVGVKISGGVRAPAEARLFLESVAEVMGLGWIEPAHVRFGASALLGALLEPERA